MATFPVHLPDGEEAEPLPVRAWRDELLAELGAGARMVTLFGRPDGDGVLVTAVLELSPGRLRVRRTSVDRERGYHALTESLPALQAFERELHEQHGVRLGGHPWLKPVRFEGGPGQEATKGYPWHRVDGRDVHEVAVGPIHAGVIEPGSFRFMCHGEEVLHLEIQLGYQHRAVERLLLERPLRHLPQLVETIAGDTSVAHGWAHAAAMEGLGGVEVGEEVELARAVLLELERVAMHLATLAGMATDVAHLQGGTTYGRLRTTAINTTMRLCGSRFGRSAVRPGGSPVALDATAREVLGKAVDLLTGDLRAVNDRFTSDPTVRHRLRGIGAVSTERARAIGLVGVAARAAGVPLDARTEGIYRRFPLGTVVEPSGDCWGRALVRLREMDASLAWLRAVLATSPEVPRSTGAALAPRPSRLAVAVVEGFRGEVVHAIETDAEGRLRHYKVQDPSLRNWLGLALAVRGNAISDFPICNKSFDLSYCGHDL